MFFLIYKILLFFLNYNSKILSNKFLFFNINYCFYIIFEITKQSYFLIISFY